MALRSADGLRTVRLPHRSLQVPRRPLASPSLSLRRARPSSSTLAGKASALGSPSSLRSSELEA
eukprot:3654390-Alexandrium_andersonii.AAC.1